MCTTKYEKEKQLRCARGIVVVRVEFVRAPAGDVNKSHVALGVNK